MPCPSEGHSTCTATTPFGTAYEITDVLQTMIDSGVDLRAIDLTGTYVNVNVPDDLETIALICEPGAR